MNPANRFHDENLIHSGYNAQDFSESLTLLTTAIQKLGGDAKLKTLKVDVSPDNVASVTIVKTSRLTVQL